MWCHLGSPTLCVLRAVSRRVPGNAKGKPLDTMNAGGAPSSLVSTGQGDPGVVSLLVGWVEEGGPPLNACDTRQPMRLARLKQASSPFFRSGGHEEQCPHLLVGEQGGQGPTFRPSPRSPGPPLKASAQDPECVASPSRAHGTTLWRDAGRDSEKEGVVLGRPVSWTPRYYPTLQAAKPATLLTAAPTTGQCCQAQPRTQERDQPLCATSGPPQVTHSHIDPLGRWTLSPPAVP